MEERLKEKVTFVVTYILDKEIKQVEAIDCDGKLNKWRNNYLWCWQLHGLELQST